MVTFCLSFHPNLQYFISIEDLIFFINYRNTLHPSAALLVGFAQKRLMPYFTEIYYKRGWGGKEVARFRAKPT
jgi:hypothetical protein